MLTVETATLDQLNRELESMGLPGNEELLCDAKRAVREARRAVGIYGRPVEVRVYWMDLIGWQFLARDERGNITHKEPIDGFDEHSLDDVIAEAIQVSGVDATTDAFATSPSELVALWESIPEWMMGE